MAKRKVIISERDNIAALFEGDQAIEFIIHRGDMLLGDVYLASVENILPSIDAAFVNVGGDKMGFLHSSDVQGKGDLKTRLQPKQRLVVQVMKEPTGHKGPRVTTNISLPGRFLVLMPESKGISISRKIEQQSERSRLKSIVSLIKPPGMGVIIRTEAEGVSDSDVQEDFEVLLERWQNIVSMADTAEPPTLLYRDQDLLYRVIRETVTEDVQELVVDTAFGFQRAQQLLQNWNLDKHIKATHYNGGQSIMTAMGVEREIRQALQTKVPLPSGGYLYIQPTEALCVIDVNSGKFTSLQSQAETIKITNLEACKEIARQLRLRNIGGMIVVDFIDMESRADQLAVLQAFENELAPDKSKPQIGQLSDLGLVEMTRHRQGQALSEIFTKNCIACSGSGHAIEEFNWAPPGLDSDVRPNDRNRGKYGQQRHQQQGGRPGGPQNQGGPQQQGKGGPQQQQQQGRKGQPQPQQQRGNEPLRRLPIMSSGAAQAAKQAKEAASGLPNRDVVLTPERALDEFYKEKLYQRLSVRLSNIVKVAKTPYAANSILARINPKSNDVMTLVDAIEGAAISGVMPPGISMEDEDAEGMGALGGDLSETNGEELPVSGEVASAVEPSVAEASQPVEQSPVEPEPPEAVEAPSEAPPAAEPSETTEAEPDADADDESEDAADNRPKRSRGRPRKGGRPPAAKPKPAPPAAAEPSGGDEPASAPKRGRGRPRRTPEAGE